MSDDSEVQEYLHELALLDEIESVLEGVDAALRRLDDGSFGRCEICGAELDQARLAADPLHTTCDEHAGPVVDSAPPVADVEVSGAPSDGWEEPAAPDGWIDAAGGWFDAIAETDWMTEISPTIEAGPTTEASSTPEATPADPGPA